MDAENLKNNKRYLDVFGKLVDEYIETGEPVGSRTLSKRFENAISPATIRNVMSDLEESGLLCSKHTSSGRTPTDRGWRFFINELVEVSDISELEKQALSSISEAGHSNIDCVLDKASNILSGLSNCASLVFRPTINSTIRHIDFVLLNPGKAIVILVSSDGIVENRLIEIPYDISSSALEQASNYLNTKLSGLTLDEIKTFIQDEIDLYNNGLNDLSSQIAKDGIEVFTNGDIGERVIVAGLSNLVQQSSEISDIGKIFKALDEKESLKSILDLSIKAPGIQVFVGSETELFKSSGCSMILSPYVDSRKNIIGALGVIGPSRMRYSRIINLVDYTASLLGKLL